MTAAINILLVEDSPSDVRLTKEALADTKIPHELTVVNDGEEAMNYLNRLKGTAATLPDVILLDLNMPRKTGHQVLAEIKEISDFANVPIILLTVSKQDRDINEALNLRMNYYLSKPPEAEKLEILIKAIVELNSAEPLSGKPKDEKEVQVRMVLAGNPHTSQMMLQKLSLETDPRVRSRVAENPATAASVLTALSRDENADVRLSVAENPNAPYAVLESLVKDKNEDVRLGLAANKKLPVNLLEQLASDENVFVVDNAKKTLELRKEMDQTSTKSPKVTL